MRRIAFVSRAAGFTVAVFAAPASAENLYAALATSPSGAYGLAYNVEFLAEDAQGQAMAACAKHAQDCRVSATFYNQCVAIARGSNGVFGWAVGRRARTRPARAVAECHRQNGEECKVVAEFCSGASD